MGPKRIASTSALGLLVVSGVLANAVHAGSAAAQALGAHSLGSACCADLEERIAELEATATRKGGRKVSLQIYGQVSEVIMWWNDGAEKNAYVQNNYATRNTLGFQGSARIDNDREVILVAQRQAQHVGVELLRTSRVCDQQEPDEWPLLEHARSLRRHCWRG